MNKPILTGPFVQLLTMDHLPLKGALKQNQLEIIENGAILHRDGVILAVGSYDALKSSLGEDEYQSDPVRVPMVAFPGMVDPHTHICWEGGRENDYSLRLEGSSYLEIARQGGGISYSVARTRGASPDELAASLRRRAGRLFAQGITTIEVKSGYGLDYDSEIKILETIAQVDGTIAADLVPTCLGAHIVPKDFQGSEREYLDFLLEKLLPELKRRALTNRVDIFIEEGAFSVDGALYYLGKAREMGFQPVVHGEQFSAGGVDVAVRTGAMSVDHLEEANEEAIAQLAASDVVGVALPGASIGLGCRFAPVRRMLDAGCAVAYGSDWNPGSAPMGDLLIEAAVIGTFEKVTMAETWAALTFRAAAALGLNDRGVLRTGMIADFIGFPVSDYREVLYYQGTIKPSAVWKRGKDSLTEAV